MIKKRMKIFYELFMFLCVVISVGTIWYESSYNYFIIWGTWGIFLIDYVTRLSFILIIFATIPFYYYEPLVRSFEQAFRWSVTSFLFFGNSNASPETWIGKVVIILLTIAGVIIHSVVMAIIIRFISKRVEERKISKIRKLSKYV
jgi:hypothetical protein